jgi:TolB protein
VLLINRKCWVFVLCLLASSLFALDLELTQGINSALPIGIGSFGYDNTGKEIAAIVKNDLTLSGQFRVISEPMGLSSGQEGMALWRHMGADNVVKGQVNAVGQNRYEVSFSLIDAVAQGRLIFSKTFQISGFEMRSLAHHISDLVYEKLMGERGVFSTRIAYILVQRSGDRSRHSLEVADFDGYNPKSLVTSNEPIMSPAWSPDGQKIAYVSFEKKKAQVFTVDVATGRRQLITSFTGINQAPAWSRDGRQLAVVLSKSGSAKIYLIELSSGSMKQITFGGAIDTEPSFAPDGRSLIFTSGRGGSPQIYSLTFADGRIQRVTYAGNYNARASYTPDQKHIVMLHRENTRFNIAVQDTDSGRINAVTFEASDESPSVSPNGRLILYATHEHDRGVLGVVSLDGRIHMRIPSRDGDVQEPAWSPFLG